MPRKSSAKSVAKTATQLLDERLPLAEPGDEVHRNAAILEVSNAAQLLELAADSALRGFLLCRLSPTVALIDPGRADDFVEILRKRGHTPKVVHPT